MPTRSARRHIAGRALHVAGALVLDGLDGEPSAAILAEARRRGLHTSLDTVFDGSGRWERVLPALPHCDLVTPGQAEAEAISGERDPARAARRLRELGAGTAAVTLGPEGCHVSADDFDGRVPALPVDAVDGTGAGDAFVAGFLYGRLAGWATEACARFANAAGRARDHGGRRLRGRRRPRPARSRSRRPREGPPEPALRRRRPLLRRRRRPRLLRRGVVPRRHRGHGADGGDARRGGARRDPALARARRRSSRRSRGPKPALVLRTDVANVYGPEHPGRLFSELVAGAVEQALVLDAACVVVNLLEIPGEPDLLRECVRNVAALKAACEPVGMPLMVEPLVFEPGERGYGSDGDPERIVPLVRQAVELGADVIKADFTDDLADYPARARGGSAAARARPRRRPRLRGGGAREDRRGDPPGRRRDRLRPQRDPARRPGRDHAPADGRRPWLTASSASASSAAG